MNETDFWENMKTHYNLVGQTRDGGIFLPTKSGLTDSPLLIDINHRILSDGIQFVGTNAVDFLGKIKCLENVPVCKFAKLSNSAVKPFKKFASDEGYDLVVIDIDKKISDSTYRFDTGLAVEPPDGYHVEILPRSSLSNTGWMLANSIGLIDSSYRGSLRIVLTKVDPQGLEYKDLLNTAVAQAVLRKNVHYEFEQIKPENLTSTKRGSSGFGSTTKSTQ